MALSSGAGRIIPYHLRHLQAFLLAITPKRQCFFQSFSSFEAKEYIRKRNILIDSSTTKAITNYNPLLMSALPPNNAYTIEVEKSIQMHIILFLRNLMLSLINLKSMEHWLQNKLMETIQWIDLSENSIPLSEQQVANFHGSWVYTVGLCTLDQNLLQFNFPWVPTLLLNELAQLSTNKEIPRNPVVNGYIFEERLFKEIQRSKYFYISTGQESLKFSVANVEWCKDGELVKETKVGVMYHLRYRHPVTGEGRKRNIKGMATIRSGFP